MEITDIMIPNFFEQTLIFNYFTISDISSQLGGLLAVFKSTMGSLAMFTLFKFLYDLAALMKRKY
jgi:hypothetical protein